VITRGPHRRFGCVDCHTSVSGSAISGLCSSGTSFCGNCHTGDHRQSKMDDEHDDVAGYQYKDAKCYTCHRP
jgi:hypothetical protein